MSDTTINVEFVQAPTIRVNFPRVLTLQPAPGAGTGDVVGPASATDNAIARFDSTTGKLIQNSSVTISDAGQISGIASLVMNCADDSSQVTLSIRVINGEKVIMIQ